MKFHDEELKKIARKQKSIQVRIVKVKLKTGQTEILFTNLPKETAKYTYEYHSNVNTLIGEIKDQLPRLLTDNQDEIQKVIQEIMEIGSKELVATKIPSSTNTERDKKRNWNKTCKTSKSEGF